MPQPARRLIQSGWLPGLVLVGVTGLAVVAARHSHHASSSPITPGGRWNAVWASCVIAGLALYGLGALAAWYGKVGLRTAVCVAAAVQLLPLAAPLLLSGDVHLYWAWERVLAVHHANPYRVPPSSFPDDPATRVAAREWRTQTEPYGPGWVALSRLPASVAGVSAHRAAFAFRVVATLAMLASIMLLALRVRRSSAVTFFGWNPLLAFHFAGGGHTDAWIALALIASVAYRGNAEGAAAGWVLGSMVKPVSAILFPLELARARLRFSRRFWIVLVGCGLLVAAASTATFGLRWIGAAVAVGAHGSSGFGIVHFLTETGLRHRYAVAIGALIFAAVYAVLFVHAWRTGRARHSLAASALCLCSSVLRPWYAIWPVALAAAEEDGAALVIAFGLTAYLLLGDAIPT